MIKTIKRFFLNGQEHYAEINLININRIYIMAIIMSIVHLAHVVVFCLLLTDNSDNAIKWQMGIIMAHASMLLVAGGLGLISYYLKKTKGTDTGLAIYVQFAAIILYLLHGAVVCVIDQFVTANINPYLIACVAIALVILIRPAWIFITYMAAFIIFYNLVPYTQHHEELLISVQVNSITATGVGIGLAIVLWMGNTKRLTQQRIIADQKTELEEAYALLNENIDKAVRFHKHLLPSELSAVEGIEMGAYYQPAVYMGGDFYNSFRIGDTIVFYIVDVSGHSMDGALMNIFIRETIHSFVTLNNSKIDDLHPDRVLDFLYLRYREETFADDYFVCIIVGFIHLHNFEMRYSGCGFQVAPLMITSPGRETELVCTGLPISNAVDSSLYDFVSNKMSLAPGMVLVFRTDGIIEQPLGAPGTEKGKLMYGEDRFRETLRINAAKSAEEIVQALIADFNLATKEAPGIDDDITLLVIRRN